MAKNLEEMCVLIPKTVTDAESVLYKTMLGRLKERALVNYFYALALQPDVVNYMTGKGYSLVEGEVQAKDFFKEFGIDSVVSKHVTQKGAAELSVGAVDASHNVIEYDNALDALDKVVSFNENNRLFVANVVKHGDKFIIKVYDKNATNQLSAGSQTMERGLWNTIDSVLTNHGLSLTELSKELPFMFNPLEASKIPQILKYIQTASELRHLNTSDIHLLLKIGEGTLPVKRLMAKAGGGIADTSSFIYNALRRPDTVTPDTMLLIETTLNKLRAFNGMDTNALANQISSETLAFMSTSEDYAIHDKIEDLKDKYPEITSEIVSITNKIESIRDAASKALLSLQRERNAKERKEGVTAESMDIDKIEDALGDAIASKEYYIGLLNYLMRGEQVAKDLDAIVSGLPVAGDTFTRCKEISNAILNMESMIDEYMDVLQALSTKGVGSILTDSGMADIEQDDLQSKALAIRDSFLNKKKYLNELKRQVMYDMANEVLGNAGMSQETIDALVNEEASKSSLTDMLYSVGRQSNALIGVMGSIIRDQQDKRDRMLNPIIKEIDAATKRLEKETGSMDSKFMYDAADDNRFLNPYNWDLYYTAMSAEKRRLKEEGYTGAALGEAMQNWVNANTEEVAVDVDSTGTTIRTERMPLISKYAKYHGNKADILDYYKKTTGISKATKVSATWIAEHLGELESNGVVEIYNPVNDLTAPQKTYYDRIMKLKGKLGTMLPYYAQNYYLAPQITKGVQDSMAEGHIKEGVKNWLKDTFTINDKDHELNRDYFELGENKMAIARGDMQGRIRKYIPIYYATPLRSEDRGNLLLNASTGMAHLAGVAVGYECMSDIEAICNVIGDYIVNSDETAKTPSNKDVVDGALSNKTAVFQKLLTKNGNNRTRSIVEGMIDQHIYGYTLNEKEANLAKGQVAKWSKLLLQYSSVYNLTTNLKGAVSNLIVGEFQMIIDAMAGSMVKRTGSAVDSYTLGDYVWAHDLMFGKHSTTLIDMLSNNTNSYNGLLAEIFDPTMDNYTEKSHKHYRGKIGNLIDKDWKFIGYGSGEHLIHYANMLAILHNRQVIVAGKQCSLYDAFEMTEDADGIKHLNVKTGTTTLDGQVVDEAYLNKIRGEIREFNQNMHGSMNAEDQGVIKQHLLGRAAMHLRTWMVEHYSRRYRASHFSAATKSEREGYYYTVYRCFKEMKEYRRNASAQWSTLNAHQKQNVMRCCAEITALLCGALATWGGFLDPDEYDTWIERFACYQAKRLYMDEKASYPVHIPSEGFQMAKNLFPLVNTLSKTWYVVEGLTNGDVFTIIQRGKHKGENKYWRNVKKRVLPFYHQIEQLMNLEDEDSIFTIFEMQYSV